MMQAHGEMLQTIITSVQSIESTLNEHTGLLKGIVSTLQDQSIDLAFIKGHLG